MKNLLVIIALIISLIAAYRIGYNKAIEVATTSIGFIDPDVDQFILDVDGNYYAWDI